MQPKYPDTKIEIWSRGQLTPSGKYVIFGTGNLAKDTETQYGKISKLLSLNTRHFMSIRNENLGYVFQFTEQLKRHEEWWDWSKIVIDCL